MVSELITHPQIAFSNLPPLLKREGVAIEDSGGELVNPEN